MDGGPGRGYHSPREAYVAGLTAVLPFLAGTVPFGLVTGMATKAAGLSALESVAITLIVFAGTAQIAALPLIAAGAPAGVVILTTFIINLRFLIYSASVATHFSHLPLRWRMLIGYFVTDTGFAIFMRRIGDEPGFAHRQWFFLGAGNLVAATWIASAAAGVLAGAQVPPAWQMEFAATLGILCLLVPFVRARADFAAAATAGAVALLASDAPMKLGLVIGAIAGMTVGTLAERAWAGARRA